MRVLQHVVVITDIDGTLPRRLDARLGASVTVALLARRVGRADDAQKLRVAFGLFLDGGGLDAEPLVDRRLAAEERLVPDHTGQYGSGCQNSERHQHDTRALMGMLMGVFVTTRLAVERQEHQSPRVEARHKSRNDKDPEGHHRGIGSARIGALNDCVLRHKARETHREAQIEKRDADACDRQRADHHRPEGIRHLVLEPAIVPHVLLMVHAVDDRTCAKEEHRLEEGVGEEVEHCDRVDAHACRHEHVTELRAGRIGDDALDVVLNEADGRGEEGRRGAEDHNEVRCDRREFHHRRHPADEEDTGRHHGRRVDQGRHRRRAFHCVR